VEETLDFPPNGKPPELTSTLQKIAKADPAGTLEKALERNLLKVKHDRLLTLLDLTLGEVLGYPCNVNKTRMPRCRKCSRRVCPMHPLKGTLSREKVILREVTEFCDTPPT
jgi:hypothetical protein